MAFPCAGSFSVLSSMCMSRGKEYINYSTNLNNLRNTNFCIGCFEFHFRKIFVKAHKNAHYTHSTLHTHEERSEHDQECGHGKKSGQDKTQGFDEHDADTCICTRMHCTLAPTLAPSPRVYKTLLPAKKAAGLGAGARLDFARDVRARCNSRFACPGRIPIFRGSDFEVAVNLFYANGRDMVNAVNLHA